MKKLLIILLTLSLIAGFAIPALADTTLISQDGIELYATGCTLSDIASPYLHVDVYAANDTDQKIWISADNAEIDGTPVLGRGVTLDPYSEYGDDSKNIMLMTTEDDPEGSAQVIRDAHNLEVDLVVMDSDTYKHLFEQHVSLDLTSLGDDDPSSIANDHTSLPENNTSSTSRPGYQPYTPSYAPAYTPASTSYYTLEIGSTGQAVKDLQQRLTDLGYLNDRVDGSYGLNTATAVRSFCTQNYLEISNNASPQMQALLYSSDAEYYVEPWIPLIIGPQFKYETPLYADLDNGTIYFQVVNRGDRTIRGYELYYYLEDIWGNRYVEPTTGKEVTMKTTMPQTVESGYNIYTGPITVYPYAWTYNVMVGIHRIVFDNGEIREVDPDEIVYFPCQLK